MALLTLYESSGTKMADALEPLSADELLRWAFDKFSPKFALACSFQAEESVLIDMMYRIRGSDFRIFTLDTGRLNQETYDCMDAIRNRYSVVIEAFFPDFEKVEDMVRSHGFNLFYESIELRKLCCSMRKVEPLNRALKGLDAWMTGLRREQALSRTEVRKLEFDQDHGNILKINPLADWTHEQVWSYIRANNVPYNRLHDRGYPSIGCAPCTRSVAAGEDLRAGRWWWENPETRECGLHVRGEKQRSETAKVARDALDSRCTGTPNGTGDSG
jgi:phosphoadenosine phosphosulfate reductase